MAVIAENNRYLESFIGTEKRVSEFAPKPSLVQEVESIRVEGRREEEIYLLPGTGFNVPLQIERFSKNLQEGLREGKSFSEVLEGEFQKLEQDVQGFVVEYLKEGVLFPIVLSKEIVNGKERIVGKFYNHKPLVDTVSSDERNGAVKKALVGDLKTGRVGVEDYLLSASPGSIAVMTSPPDWSGLYHSDGRAIKFPYSQTYIFQVQKDGNPRGFTVKTDMEIEKHEELQRKLKLAVPEAKDYQERIVNVVGDIAFINAIEGKEIKDIVDLIKEVHGSSIAFKDTKGRQRYFDEAYSGLENPERLWTLDEKTQEYIDQFKDYIRYSFKNGVVQQRNFEIALGIILLKLSDNIRNPRKQILTEGVLHEIKRDRPLFFDPRESLNEMQQVGGCNGGGSSNTLTINSITPRDTILGENNSLGNEEDEYGPLTFKCPHSDCSKENKRERGKLLEKCQHCGKDVKCG